jgi:hypothetical protein
MAAKVDGLQLHKIMPVCEPSLPTLPGSSGKTSRSTKQRRLTALQMRLLLLQCTQIGLRGPFWSSIRIQRGSCPLPNLLGYLAEGFTIGSSGWVEEVKGWRVGELAPLRTLISRQAIGLPHGGR